MGAKITELPEVLGADVAAVDVTVLSSIGEAESKKLTVAELAKALLALGGGTAITPATIAGQQNDYEPAGAAGAAIWRLSAASPGHTITGLAGGFAGRVLVIANVGAYPILLKEESAASAEPNRIATGPNGGNPTLEQGALWTLVYDGTLARWVIAGLEKNATTTRPGLMSHTDKTKLDGIEVGANATVLSDDTTSSIDASVGEPGISIEVSRADHTHQVETDVPEDVSSSASAEGVANKLARADHIHYHGELAGGALHELAESGGAAGFMSGSDKDKLDSLSVPTVVVEANSTHTFTDADDGKTFRCTHATGCVVSIASSGLTPGKSARFVQWDADSPVNVGGGAATIRHPATFGQETAEQYSSLVVTILDNGEVLLEGDLAPP